MVLARRWENIIHVRVSIDLLNSNRNYVYNKYFMVKRKKIRTYILYIIINKK